MKRVRTYDIAKCTYAAAYRRIDFKLGMYSDSQNYLYSDKVFLSRPLLQWKKGGENWKILFELNK